MKWPRRKPAEPKVPTRCKCGRHLAPDHLEVLFCMGCLYDMAGCRCKMDWTW